MFTNKADEIVVSPVVRQVLECIGHRVESRCPIQNEPHLTVIAFPESPNPPTITPSNIYKYLAAGTNRSLLIKEGESDFGTRRITGGVCFLGASGSGFYQEINKYGVIYHREACLLEGEDEQKHLCGRFIAAHVQGHVRAMTQFYIDNQHEGDIAVTVRLCDVSGQILQLRNYSPYKRVASIESDVSASIRLPSNGVLNHDYYITLFEELFWSFNVEAHEWQEFKEWFEGAFPSGGR